MPLDDLAPEDEETPLPSSFPEVLRRMETPISKQHQEFLDLFETHIYPEFVKQTKVIELLKTKGVKVFLNNEWTGISGIEPIDLVLRDNLPPSIKPKARPINPRLFENAKIEFDRLCEYLYEPSFSPHASPLVIAPKATKPFIRFCGDYVFINQFSITGHQPIPHVQYTIVNKIGKFKIFLDLDMTNSFHQFRLSKKISALLSVVTPWGQWQPKFMPEGIGPASGILQREMSTIFKDFDEWCIVIFDNILILAHDYADAYSKLEIFLDRCIERNITLKFAKSWLGFIEVKFFGYLCRHDSFCMTNERKEHIQGIPFPTNQKSMQSFLGAALFFKDFVANYSQLTAKLNDMSTSKFNWDSSTWVIDYKAVFQQFKDELQRACALFYPDYELPWILRTDASETGIGGVLLQIKTNESGNEVMQPISFVSKKFSDPATRWSTIEQECYGIYFCVHHFGYFLRCKFFVLETDHNNLRWMSASEVPKITRWRIFLQSFNFLIRHIPGKHNTVADWQSRFFLLLSTQSDEEGSVPGTQVLSHVRKDLNNIPKFENSEEIVETDRIKSAFDTVHGGRSGHWGVRATYNLLNEHFPGHNIPYKMVSEMVATCPVCQKVRLGLVDNIRPVVRHLKPEFKRSAIGIDTLTVTPKDKFGNSYIDVIVVFGTKFTVLYPKSEHSGQSIATSIFQFLCTYGLYDSLVSDPGSDLMSEVVEHLNKWFGIQHVVSLVDRHQSNGVEGTNKQILRHLKSLVMDEKIKNQWSSPTVLPLIQFFLNSTHSSETGVIPFHATFGSQDATYMRLPENLDAVKKTHEFVKLLDKNLQILWDISKKFQSDLALKRVSETPVEKQNKYQPGDFVLFHQSTERPLPNKLTPRFLGPYEVVIQNKNDVQCRDLVKGSIKIFHVEDLKIFHGTKQQAIEAARTDGDQELVERFLAYRGDPKVRTTVEFEVLFADGDIVWLPFSEDLFAMVQYEEFCSSTPGLWTMIFRTDVLRKIISQTNKLPITRVRPKDEVFVDIRVYGEVWYTSIGLPDQFHIKYVVKWKYLSWSNKLQTKILVSCPMMGPDFSIDHSTVLNWGSTKLFNDNLMQLVTAEMMVKFPLLKA
jgi:hypothetical protein